MSETENAIEWRPRSERSGEFVASTKHGPVLLDIGRAERMTPTLWVRQIRSRYQRRSVLTQLESVADAPWVASSRFLTDWPAEFEVVVAAMDDGTWIHCCFMGHEQRADDVSATLDSVVGLLSSEGLGGDSGETDLDD